MPVVEYIYFGSLVLLLIPLLFCIYNLFRKEKSALRNAVIRLLLIQIITIFVYGMAIMTVNESLALFFYALFYLCITFLTYTLFQYSRIYADTSQNRRWISFTSIILIAADACLLFSNSITKKIFTVEQVEDSFGMIFYSVTERGIWYHLHIGICYLFAFSCLLVLLYRRIKCPKAFRVNYRSIILTLILTALCNFMFFQFGTYYDFSMIGYTLSCVAITYFSFFHVPAGLVEKMLTLFIKTIEDGVVCFDVKGKCIYANEQAKRILHVDRQEEIDDRFLTWLDGKAVWEVQDTVWNETINLDGKKCFFQFEYKKMVYDKRELGSFFLFRDWTEEVERVKLERYKANHDKLTDLYNREYFYEKAEKMLRDNPDTEYYIACSDIRDFKLVNDMYGTKQGDDILIKLAESIRQKTPQGCVYGRLAGDRFAICLPKELYQENIFRKEIARIEQMEGPNNLRLRMYMGIYDVDNREMPVSVMCDRAIMAIKTIKDDAANRIVYYDKELRDSALREQKIIGQFHDALENGQFCFYIQPQISVDGTVRGGEALVRWIHPEQGMIPPGEFIELFERTGLISELDRYIWEKACIQLRDWRRQGHPDYYLSVNISPRDFYYMDIYKVFTGLIQKHGCEAKNLHLEITETAVMADTKKVVKLVNKLRQYGFKVEMDDFGSGYSSLNMLKDIKMDTIKLDMGFLRKTNNQERSMAIVGNVISLSKKLGMEVVTEGVETKEQVESLRSMGCDVFQGYYFAKPMSVWDYEDRYIPVEE